MSNISVRLFLVLMSVVTVGCSSLQTTVSRQDEKKQIYGNLAQYYLQQGELQRAEEYLLKAEQAGFSSYKLEHAKAVLLVKQNESSGVAQHFQSALELSQQDNAPMHDLIMRDYASYLCNHQDTEAGLELLDTQSSQNTIHSQLVTAQCHLMNQDLTTAEHQFRQVINQGEYPPALYGLAKIEFEQASYLPARGLLQRYFLQGAASSQAKKLAVDVESALARTKTIDAIDRLDEEKSKLAAIYPQVKWDNIEID